jgi:hypothetical protein
VVEQGERLVSYLRALTAAEREAETATVTKRLGPNSAE